MEVWAVVFSNYEPPEVDSLWPTEEEAEARADELNESYDWCPWEPRRWTLGRTGG